MLVKPMMSEKNIVTCTPARQAVTPRNKAREREARERETTGYEPFALHASIHWAM